MDAEKILGPLTQEQTETLLVACIDYLTPLDVVRCLKAAYVDNPDSLEEIAAQIEEGE